MPSILTTIQQPNHQLRICMINHTCVCKNATPRSEAKTFPLPPRLAKQQSQSRQLVCIRAQVARIHRLRSRQDIFAPAQASSERRQLQSPSTNAHMSIGRPHTHTHTMDASRAQPPARARFDAERLEIHARSTEEVDSPRRFFSRDSTDAQQTVGDWRPGASPMRACNPERLSDEIQGSASV